MSVETSAGTGAVTVSRNGGAFEVQWQHTIACCAIARAHAACSPQANAACGDATTSVKE
ncbi:hypothetical protein [Xanthomonas phaseoli]|uniref:hypothetical protein n=1 Tax=Xanthomonas phaseoli TaxID=1985254 RepID=UPI00135F16D1|nr:hypothetical protein [Xanthomonas phaseoli]